MRPEVPDLLQDVLALAERVLKKASRDPRRLDAIEQLLERLDAAQHWPTDEPRRFVDARTLQLVRELRTIERVGMLDRDELELAVGIAALLLKRVQADAYQAMLVRARAGREPSFT